MSTSGNLKQVLFSGLILISSCPVSATECKPLEFAELQSLQKDELQYEYCVAQLRRNGLTKQLELSAQMDENKLAISAIDRKSDPSIGVENKQETKARDACDAQLTRIERIAKTKKYKLKC